MRTEVKICGLTRRDDVEAVVELGFAYAGAVLFAGSKRYVPVEKLPALFGGLDGKIRRVGVFVNASKSEIESALATGCLDIVQLHGEEAPELAEELSAGAEVWKAVVLTSSAEVERYRTYPAARLLADSPGGGSGSYCDWRYAALLARYRPLMLAGGIGPANAAVALDVVQPAGLDLASGVEESYGIKSIDKMRQLKEVLT